MNKLLIALTLLILAGPTWAAPDLNEAANDVCKCLEDPYAQAKKAIELVNTAKTSGDMSALVSAQGEIMKVVNASNQCFDALTKQYPEIAQSRGLQDQVMAIAEEQCPNPASAMSAEQ